MEDAIKKADILIEALPYIRKFQDKFIVVKYGGSALTDKKKRLRVLEDIIFMRLAGMRPVIVHGGGPYISKRLKQKKVRPVFVDGLRVTDDRVITVVEEALAALNSRIVNEIRLLGGKAQGLPGTKVIRAKRHRNFEKLGFVGEIINIDTAAIEGVAAKDSIPVITPLGMGRDGRTYNINADQASAHVAKALAAEKLALLTNVDGIYKKDGETHLSSVTKSQAMRMIKKGVIGAGMIPKVKACILAINGGVKKAHIINGSLGHALLLEIFTDTGIGTEVVK